MTPSRRHFLATGLALPASFWLVPGVFAEELTKTPKQTEGPFYPDKLPLDTDNDLILINDKTTPAVGEISHLTGKIKPDERLTPAWRYSPSMPTRSITSSNVCLKPRRASSRSCVTR